MSQDLGKQFTEHKVKHIAVGVISDPQGGNSPLGDYFAKLLSRALKLDPDEPKTKSERSVLSPSEERRIAKAIAAAKARQPIDTSPDADTSITITGTIENRPKDFLLKVAARETSDGSTLASASASLDRSDFLNSIDSSQKKRSALAPSKAGVDGVSLPRCQYCPDPQYSQEARDQRLQATILVLAIVTPEGRVEFLYPVKVAGYGLEEQAYKALQKWQLQPARDSDGTPIAVETPIEMTFRLN